MSISQFASLVNHPLCKYMAEFATYPRNADKTPLHFLNGDPTAYGNDSFKMPPEGYEIMKKHIMNQQSHGYTVSSGVPSARQAILGLYHPQFQLTINDVTIQHGVNQGLLVTLMAFTNPGDQILVPETGYPIFTDLGPALGVKVIPYKLKPHQHFQIDLDSLHELVTEKTQFLFVINPSNPMGTIFSKKHMEQIIHFCDTHQLPIVADEVYHGESFEDGGFHSFGDITVNVPVLVLCGVQKVLSVPGWCTSWTVLFDKNQYLQQVWRNIQTAGMIFLHSNKFTQLALPQILSKVGLFNQEPIKKTKAIHQQLCNSFNAMKGYKAIQSQGTFYMVVIIEINSFKNIRNDIQYVRKLLEEQNVAFMPLSIFGGQNNGFRVLTCAKPQIYNEVLKRIQNFNKRYQVEI